jgi:hypothetical protein
LPPEFKRPSANATFRELPNPNPSPVP